MGIQINGQTDTVTATDGSINIGGDVTIPGVLTYEDVTSVDAVGLSTFQNGIHVTGGSVGINETSPVRKLHVKADNAPVARFERDTSDGEILEIRDFNNNQIGGFGSDTGDLTLSAYNSNNLRIETGGSERLRITSSGNVGIGTDNPTQKLKVYAGSIEISRFNGEYTGDAVNGQTSVFIHPGSAAGAGSGSAISIVGGTASATTLFFGDTADADIGSISYVHPDNSLRFTTNTEEKLRITSSGNVGIQTNNPYGKLHIGNSPEDVVNDVDTTNTSLIIKQSTNTRDDGIYIERGGERKGYYMWLNPGGGAGDGLTFSRNNAGTYSNTLILDRNANAHFGGNAVFASGNGIDFSATADSSGTTNSELLDDYEEGSWTPAVARTSPTGSATHTRQSGRYTRIGNVVTIWFDIEWSAAPNGSGDYVITSLPYTAQTGVSAGDGGFGAVQFRDASGLSSNIRIYGNSSYHADTRIFCQHYDGSGNVGNSPFNASGRITGWSQYFV